MHCYSEPEHPQSFEFEPYGGTLDSRLSHRSSSCSQGHRSSLILETQEGGSICLLCFSNLISNPQSRTIHVSYALSQLSQAISQPTFLRELLSFNPHVLVSPLVEALSSFDDEPIARQSIDIVVELCKSGGGSVYGDFLARIASRLSSGALAWSRRQVYTLHCLGILLGYPENDPYSHISDKDALIFNLVTGLHLPSEEIQGEIFFVLYKISLLQYAYKEDDVPHVLLSFCPKLLRLSLDALMKTQSDDVRLNCVALLTVLAQRGFFEHACANDTSSKHSCEADNFMQMTEHLADGPPLNILFAEAIKAPLLSSDSEVQASTMDLIFLYMSSVGGPGNEIRVLVEENIADYVFEILRLSGCKDPVLTSCLQVLDLLSTAEEAFSKRLAIGFSMLIPALRYVAEVPFHPVQAQTLKLIWNCVSNCPGIVSTSHIEELGLILSGMLKRYTDGDMGMLTDTFSMACSIFVAIMKCPCHGTPNFSTSIRDASRNAILTCLNHHGKYPSQFMDSLYLLKEAYSYSHKGNTTSCTDMELRNCILNICKTDLLPRFVASINEIEEEDIVLGVLETFHSILLQDSDELAIEFANILVASSWFSFTFGCLGLFSTEKMKWRVYLMLSSVVDLLQGNDLGQPIRDAALNLPSDPIDLLFLLGQKSSNNIDLLSCQFAALLILHTSSLYDDRLADEKLVLASLEQYILVNTGEFQYGASESAPVELLVNLYGLYRSLAKNSYQISYSPDAERVMFHLVTEKEWDLPSTRIHPTSLKWWFQQEKICKPLSIQILKICRCNSCYGNHIIMHGNNSQNIGVGTIAELVASSDNLASTLLVYVLKDLIEDHQEHDIISVVSILAVIINNFPAASDQLCLHGIGSAIQSLFFYSWDSSPQIFMVTCQVTFGILHSVHSESLSEDEAWLAIAMKLMDYLVPTVTADRWSEESLIVVGILSLMLHHSTNQALVETSKTILLSTSLVSIINTTISATCAKGASLIDHDEGTKTGEALLIVLSLHLFSLRSTHVVLPGNVDWENLLDEANGTQPLSLIRIHCQDLCRLIHFGSALVKLVASYCLLELFTRISDQKNNNSDNVNRITRNLLSVEAVLEGLVFCSDIRVATNCSLCLSMILGWENLNTSLRANPRNNWCRLIVEELAMSLAVPQLASDSFMFHHKPAVHIAVALLKQHKIPQWMVSVFDDSCISGIVDNLSANNVSTEMVLLFRELMHAGYLKVGQIASLNRVFQVCRKHLYTKGSPDNEREEDMGKDSAVPEGTGKVLQALVKIMIMPSKTSLEMEDPSGYPHRSSRLLEEIELFAKSLMEED